MQMARNGVLYNANRSEWLGVIVLGVILIPYKPTSFRLALPFISSYQAAL